MLLIPRCCPNLGRGEDGPQRPYLNFGNMTEILQETGGYIKFATDLLQKTSRFTMSLLAARCCCLAVVLTITLKP